MTEDTENHLAIYLLESPHVGPSPTVYIGRRERHGHLLSGPPDTQGARPSCNQPVWPTGTREMAVLRPLTRISLRETTSGTS